MDVTLLRVPSVRSLREKVKNKNKRKKKKKIDKKLYIAKKKKKTS